MATIESNKIYLLSVFDKQDASIRTDHVFKKKQEAINYFEVHYSALKYRYDIDYTNILL
jgi:hypothetical protein